MSILVMTTMTGTFKASAMPRCSLLGSSVFASWVMMIGQAYLLMPIKPLFAATISKQ